MYLEKVHNVARRSYSNEKLLHKNKCKRLKMTYFCIHTLCVRNTYPADDRTILYMCDLNALGGFNFFYRRGPSWPRLPHTNYLMQS